MIVTSELLATALVGATENAGSRGMTSKPIEVDSFSGMPSAGSPVSTTSEAWTASRNKSAGTTVVNRLSLANDVHHYDGLTGRRNWDSKRRTPGGSAQLSQPRP